MPGREQQDNGGLPRRAGQGAGRPGCRPVQHAQRSCQQRFVERAGPGRHARRAHDGGHLQQLGAVEVGGCLVRHRAPGGRRVAVHVHARQRQQQRLRAAGRAAPSLVHAALDAQAHRCGRGEAAAIRGTRADRTPTPQGRHHAGEAGDHRGKEGTGTPSGRSQTCFSSARPGAAGRPACRDAAHVGQQRPETGGAAGHATAAGLHRPMRGIRRPRRARLLVAEAAAAPRAPLPRQPGEEAGLQLGDCQRRAALRDLLPRRAPR